MKTAVISLALVNVVLGNFWYGCLSGDENNMQGSISNKCTYVLYKEGDKACTAGGSNPDDGSGGCPGQNMKAPNWCGETIGLGCPSGWKLDKSGDCGAAMEAANKDGKEPAFGTLYANIYDTDNNNKYVGHCAYEQKELSYCSDVIDTFIPEQIIHCYTIPGSPC